MNDGLTVACANNGSNVWSYNQGLAIGGFTELWRTTGDSSLLTTARTLADAAISSPALTSNGVLTESCDLGSASCDDNQKQFKGIFMRHFADLTKATDSSTYQSFVQKQSNTPWARDRGPSTPSANAGPAPAPTKPTGAPKPVPSARSPPPQAESRTGRTPAVAVSGRASTPRLP
ncbi:glycoside hydrolase family 76 protein [Streptomyces avermitilis]|uniref:glycoside hydrolase family 76 protein n=1 Tax=Streptomyces avermitilis TaxID=33903 RepID=UPI00372338DF